MSVTPSRVPVTVLTGFLGSGKTTLLNRILSEKHGKRIAVIENEFGEVGVDHQLVIGAEEELFETNNGCICCTVRGDLIRILGQLMKRRDKFDYIIIETTGMADPGPVAQTFFLDDELKNQFSARRHRDDGGRQALRAARRRAQRAGRAGGVRRPRAAQQDRSRRRRGARAHRAPHPRHQRHGEDPAHEECRCAHRPGAERRRVRPAARAHRGRHVPRAGVSVRVGRRVPAHARRLSTEDGGRARSLARTSMAMHHDHDHDHDHHEHDHDHDGHTHEDLDVVVLPLPAATPAALEAAIEPAVRAFAEPATVVPCHGTLDAAPSHNAIDISHPGADFTLHDRQGRRLRAVLRAPSAGIRPAPRRPAAGGRAQVRLASPRRRHQLHRHQRSAAARSDQAQPVARLSAQDARRRTSSA